MTTKAFILGSVISFIGFVTTTAVAAEMKVVTTSKETATPGPAEYFTGKVSVKRLVVGEQPSNLTCGSVEFAAGARSNWHTHPKGQLFIVTNGEGLVQEFGKPIQKIKVGDVVWTPANVKHWHGAGANTSMTHSAVTETSDGKAVEWLERVTDAEYSKAPK